MGGLDSWLPIPIVKEKPKPVPIGIPCSKCKQLIPPKEPQVTLKIKGIEEIYCKKCRDKILNPLRPTEPVERRPRRGLSR